MPIVEGNSGSENRLLTWDAVNVSDYPGYEGRSIESVTMVCRAGEVAKLNITYYCMSDEEKKKANWKNTNGMFFEIVEFSVRSLRIVTVGNDKLCYPLIKAINS